MNAILIILGLTRLSAAIEILFLLLVAVSIGYITSWLYHKSAFADRIKVIESENGEINKDLVVLRDDNGKLYKTLVSKDLEINKLNAEIKSLKISNNDWNRSPDVLKLKNSRTRQLILEKDESLTNLAQRKKLLDYQSFGT